MPKGKIRLAYDLIRAEFCSARGCERTTAQFFAHMQEIRRLREAIRHMRAMIVATWRPPSGTGKAAQRVTKRRRKENLF